MPVDIEEPVEEPVEVLGSDVDSEEDVPRKNLEKKFDHVAGQDDPRSDVAEPSSPAPKPSRRGKSKAKAKASPKARTKPPSPKLKRPTAAKSRARHPKTKTQKKVESGDRAEDKGPGEPNEGGGDGGKKTFAGRYCPKGGEAKMRWQCLKEVFNGSIRPHLACQASAVEAWFLIFFHPYVLNLFE